MKLCLLCRERHGAVANPCVSTSHVHGTHVPGTCLGFPLVRAVLLPEQKTKSYQHSSLSSCKTPANYCREIQSNPSKVGTRGLFPGAEVKWAVSGRCLSHLFLKTSNDCASPAHKGSLLLSLPLIIVGKFVLISNVNLPCFQLSILLFVTLSVDIKATDFHPLYSNLWRLLSCCLQSHPSSLC